jgi:hypothetical protein
MCGHGLYDLWQACAQSIPNDLNADGEQDERRESRNDGCTCFSKGSRQPVGVTVGSENQSAKEKYTH